MSQNYSAFVRIPIYIKGIFKTSAHINRGARVEYESPIYIISKYIFILSYFV
jgi:hypothetical protein